jgi:hypothetical protein
MQCSLELIFHVIVHSSVLVAFVLGCTGGMSVGLRPGSRPLGRTRDRHPRRRFKTVQYNDMHMHQTCFVTA